MKALVLFILMTFSLTTEAITYSVTGPCSKKPLNSGEVEIDLNSNLGVISMALFDQAKIPYDGSELGMSSIHGTPVGLDAIEVLSDTKMRAYGWCFSINGFIPDTLSNEVFFKAQSDHLMWFFAYSTYDQGVWTDYCVPSYEIKAEQFCKNL